MPLPPPIPERKALADSPAQDTPRGLNSKEIFGQAFALHQQGKLAEAKALYGSVLRCEPQHFDALNLLGVIALQERQYVHAAELIANAISLNSNVASAHANRGIALKELGQWDAALVSYERAIALDAGNADTYFNRGIVLKILRRHSEAVASYDQAIRINPNYAAAYCNRGNALKEAGQLEAAVLSYDSAIKIQPNYAEAYSNRGSVLRALSRFEEAIASYDRAIEIRPSYAQAHYNRGGVLQDLKQPQAAVASFDRAISIQPDYAEAYLNRGTALHALNQWEAAIASYDSAIAIKPAYAEAYSNRGISLQSHGQLHAAVASYDRAIAINPNYAPAYSNRGIALQALDRPSQAIASYQQAIAINPGYSEAFCNLGNAHKDLDQLEKALTCYETAIRLNPLYAEAFYNRGLTHEALGNFAASIADYDQAIAANPAYASAYWNKSLVLLLRGEFELGWPLYEWRWQRAESACLAGDYSMPLWLGNAQLAGKTILLHSEQGLGDTIQFCRYVAMFAELGAEVLLQVPPSLSPLMRGLENVSEIIGSGADLSDCDFHCPLLSLPLAFKTTLSSIPSPGAYLKSNSEKRLFWGDRIHPRVKPRVGLAWSGNSLHKNDKNRSIALQQLIPHLPSNCDYFCLQKEVRESEQDFLLNSSIQFFGSEIKDFADTAALCDLMDVVVSVDTSVAHLAGALGRPTYVMLPYLPDWRWLLNRDDSPWYPTLRLYRQSADRDWTMVMKNVAADLQLLS